MKCERGMKTLNSRETGCVWGCLNAVKPPKIRVNLNTDWLQDDSLALCWSTKQSESPGPPAGLAWDMSVWSGQSHYTPNAHAHTVVHRARI